MPIGPGSYTQLPPNSTGPKLATGPTYTENAQTVQDEKVLLGEQYVASYTVAPNANLSIATGAAHVLQIMAGASLKVRIRRIEIFQVTMATTVTMGDFQVWRLSTAGTGGTAVTPSLLDPADAASGATAMTLPTVKGTETVLIARGMGLMLQTLAASSDLSQPRVVFDFDFLRSKPLIIAAGVANGIAIKSGTAVAAATVTVNLWLDEGAF